MVWKGIYVRYQRETAPSRSTNGHVTSAARSLRTWYEVDAELGGVALVVIRVCA
jgi:hypothetical protein